MSDYQVKQAKLEGCTDEEIQAFSEDDLEIMQHFQSKNGYFIAYENLFSTWIRMGKDFDVSNVRDALSAFRRLINLAYKKVFADIFTTLQTGLSKLGESTGAQTKAIKALLSKKGIIIADMDLLIASTAITHNLILATVRVE